MKHLLNLLADIRTAPLSVLRRMVPTMQTGPLLIDLISDVKRINSHIYLIACPILDSARTLAPSWLRVSDALASVSVKP